MLSYPATLQVMDDWVRQLLFTADSSQDPAGVTPDHWQTEKRRNAINQGIQKVYLLLCQKFEDEYYVRAREGISPVNNIIQLPEDTRRVLGFFKKLGGQWVPISIVSSARYHEYAMPYVDPTTLYALPVNETWEQVGRQIIMAGTGTATGPYKLKEQVYCKELQGKDDVCDLPREYQNAACYFAAGTLAANAGQDDRAAQLLQMYGNEEMSIVRTATMTNVAKSHRVRDVRRSAWR